MLAFQITYRGIKIGIHVYVFIYHIVRYFSRNMFIYIYIYIYIYNTDKKKIITQNIHANCFRWDYDLHACVLHSHETPKFQNDRGGTDPTD